MRKCPHCGSKMKPKGALNSSGAIRFKCRNKRCGRTVYEEGRSMGPSPRTMFRPFPNYGDPNLGYP